MAVGTKVGPLTFYVASASPASPVCAYGESTKKGEGLAVGLYYTKKGRLKGVTVTDMDSEKSVVIGDVPAAAIEDGMLEEAEVIDLA